jgi:hypothetical protein
MSKPLRVSTKYPTHAHFASRQVQRKANAGAMLRHFVPGIYPFCRTLTPKPQRSKEREAGKKWTDTKRLLYI